MTTEKTPEQLAHEIGQLMGGQQIGTVANALAMAIAHFACHCGSDPARMIEVLAHSARKRSGVPTYAPEDLSADRVIN